MFPISRRVVLFGKAAYSQKILSTRYSNLVGYWPLWESVGVTVALDQSSRANNGAYGAGATSPTLGQLGIGDGKTCASFDSGDFVDLYSAGFDADFSGAEGTFAAWARITNAAVWGDGVERKLCQFRTSTNSLVAVMKYTNANTLRFQYTAGATTEAFNTTDYAVTTWLHIAFTWSKSAEVVYGYVNGTQIGTSGTLGVWGGTLNSALCCVGAGGTTPAGAGWIGLVAHPVMWNVALTQPEIARLSTP